MVEGGLNFLQKPFTSSVLAQKVREVLGQPASSLTVLVDDDEADIRHLLRRFLSNAGYSVLEAGNGREALDQLRSYSIDVLICDIVMPERDGLEILRPLKSESPNLKTIVTSGAFGGKFLRTAEMLGAHATLKKPLRESSVLKAIHKVLISP